MKRIVCAAVKFTNGTVILGARHYDKSMVDVILKLPEMKESEQGFIDQYGNFYNREDSLKIATTAEQLRRKTGNKHQLFSEDLY